MTTVEVRSYSRNSGRISCEIESGTSIAFKALVTASSFLALAKENRSEMAMDCGFAAVTRAASERNSSGLGSVKISPSAEVRSWIPKRRSLGTRGSMRSKKKS